MGWAFAVLAALPFAVGFSKLYGICAKQQSLTETFGDPNWRDWDQQ